MNSDEHFKTNEGGGANLKIPLPTKFDYLCSEDGKITRDGKEIKGHKAKCRKSGKYYQRVALVMQDGKKKKFYVQRIVAMTYLGLDPSSDNIVRHMTTDTFNNHKDQLKVGTHLENQTIDRKESGNYMNRGKQKDNGTTKEHCPF